MLLEALALGCQRLARTRLLVAGTGPAAADLERRSRSLGIADRVRFLGHVPDAELPDLYRAADITVMPSRALEGFGLSTLESLASGTPVIATPVGGSVEILEELDPALLAEEVSSGAIAAALSQWCSPRAPLAELRDRCRPFVESRYTWEQMARGIEHVAAELTGTLVAV